jgi:uncharacterized DUF497 family protein
VEFDWDEGNEGKNLRHGVHDWEIEEALLDLDLVRVNRRVVEGEERFAVLGRAEGSGRYLKIIYTVRVRGRTRLVRPISAVDMDASERASYRRR